MAVSDPVASILAGLAAVVSWGASFDLLGRAYLQGRRRLFDRLRRVGGLLVSPDELVLGRMSFTMEFGSDVEVEGLVSEWETGGRGSFARAWTAGTMARMEGRLREAVGAFCKGAQTTVGVDRAELLYEAALLGSQQPRAMDHGQSATVLIEHGRMALEADDSADPARVAYVRALGLVALKLVLAEQADAAGVDQVLAQVFTDLGSMRSLRARRLMEVVMLERVSLLRRLNKPNQLRAELKSRCAKVRLRSLVIRLEEVTGQQAEQRLFKPGEGGDVAQASFLAGGANL